jgi:hypothetical protein
MLLRAVVPQKHLRRESKESVHLATGVVATIAALVLGLLVASAMDSFDKHRDGLHDLATKTVLLDGMLEHFGSDAAGARKALHLVLASAIDRAWPPEGKEGRSANLAEVRSENEQLYRAVRELTATNDAQKALQTEAMSMLADLAKTRWYLSHPDDTTIPPLFVSLLIFWLFVLFVSFGLFAPTNATVIASLMVCAVSVAGAMLMIIDLDQPVNGLLQVSSAPLKAALAQVGGDAKNETHETPSGSVDVYGTRVTGSP